MHIIYGRRIAKGLRDYGWKENQKHVKRFGSLYLTSVGANRVETEKFTLRRGIQPIAQTEKVLQAQVIIVHSWFAIQIKALSSLCFKTLEKLFHMRMRLSLIWLCILNNELVIAN